MSQCFIPIAMFMLYMHSVCIFLFLFFEGDKEQESLMVFMIDNMGLVD